MAICERCATESPSGYRFCGACGAPLPLARSTGDARKVVTALFCDIVGSTALGEGLDPEVLHGVLSGYFETITATIERHGGTVQKFAGDAVLAVFGIPRVHEDDALRAVRAAVEINDQLPSIAERIGVEIQLRTGINTGLVLTDEGKTLAMGDAVNVAARLEQTARPGEIVIGADTLALVRDAVVVEPLEPRALKGKSAPVAAYRLLSINPVAPGVARRFDVPLVGRERELGLLREICERTVQASECRLFTLLGTAGVGKSRLSAELQSLVSGGATVLTGRCLPYGEGITFWPVIEAPGELGEPAEQIRAHLSSGGLATPEELVLEVRRLLEQLASDRPVLLHLDDLQWAEPMLLALIDHIAELSHGSPILMLCTARPELLDTRPDWGAGRTNTIARMLEPLGRTECEALLDELGNPLDAPTRARVIQASDGNPLFIQEIVSFARERRTVDVPPTIQALLTARLERLTAQKHELLERGAVEGQVFHQAAVRAMLDEIIGWHLEQAVRYRRELSQTVDPALARRAAERLYRAGRRAGDRSDVSAARSLLERALSLAPADERLRRHRDRARRAAARGRRPRARR